MQHRPAVCRNNAKFLERNTRNARIQLQSLRVYPAHGKPLASAATV